MTATPDRWTLAAHAVAALAVDPIGLGGMVLRDRAGPVRDAVLSLMVEQSERPVQRLPATLHQAALSGALDLSETLRTGRKILGQDLLRRAAGSLLVVPMAERIEGGTASLLASALDSQTDVPLMVLLDEGVEADETAPQVLTDRLAISLSLDDMARAEIGGATFKKPAIQAARKATIGGGGAAETLIKLAAAMGITSLRAPLLALRLARALAALAGAARIEEPHIAIATILCLAPRATVIPSTEAPEEETPHPPEEQQDTDQKSSSNQGKLEDRVLDAVEAALPDLALNGAKDRGRASETGAGNRKRSASHGRPIRSRPGKPDGKRLDVFATLLAAAPWQPLRRQAQPDRKGLIVVPDDFRIKQYDCPAESVLIFLVDASGSQAAARMAEAKGAVELMLAEAYRRREKVALISFRGTVAELILPPTRSLLQAKRRLAVMPGGGPTPLASALVAGRELADQIRRRDATPYLVALTDGRGNIDLTGEPGRGQAAKDQEIAAKAIAAQGITCALIDTANRPQQAAQELARSMAARYLPLPRADAHGISKIVRAGIAV